MNSRAAHACAFVCAWAVTCETTSAHAQTATGRPTNPQAVEHFQQGNAHYKVRDFEKAVEEYKAGALIEAAAIFDYNLGQCYRQLTLAKYQDAVRFYDRYLRSGFATPDDVAAIQKWTSEMKAEMDQRAKSTPPTKPATMQPQPAPALVAHPDVQPWYHDAFGWGLAGSGVLVAGIGGALLLDASSLRGEANRTPNQQEQNALKDKADSRALTGTILAIGGGALLVTGIEARNSRSFRSAIEHRHRSRRRRVVARRVRARAILSAMRSRWPIADLVAGERWST
jgi:hypothetical protein